MTDQTVEEIVIVHWPGKSTPACPEHLRQLVGLAAVLGFRVEWTPVPHGLEKCSNCESGKKRAEPSRGAPDADAELIAISLIGKGRIEEFASVLGYVPPDGVKVLSRRPLYLRCGHVVLLEALKHALPILIGAIAFVDCKAVVAEVQAAIKQAERT